MKIHEKYMSRCIQLAKNGLGTTYPNPLVGSVLVYNDKIIGEGWHYQAGLPHAEVNAMASVSTSESDNLLEATMYVSLEPCSHFGKTPPCADLIIEKGIKKVVVGSTDPNPKVAGRGIKKLLEAGCEVIVGVLETECDALNKRFFTFQNKKRPFIFLKWAQTANGFIAPLTKEKKEPVWITNEYSRQLVHKMRSQEQAILVGTNTVLEDNPSLTTRNWKGTSPIRVVIDRALKIAETASVYDQSAPTIFISEKARGSTENIYFETVDFSEALPLQICEVLYKYDIQSLIVEGGTKMLQQFIDASIWDEAIIFTGKTTFTNGVKAPVFEGTLLSEENIQTDTLQYYKNNNS
ncbi:bifunctional diaminohydroxyphosphoribosylaminopyrimidine deaminase/5-amino-6-(5-phosphoribosylamino)uracil reductase RibD [Jejudonia soesokkakensis]|uniref:Riboflavin biosynthesis protein RibD n=1 Tax=Jejudonia soesokkakensis TaxID=1323432 RepID=A0ABW2MYE4_9FLAO